MPAGAISGIGALAGGVLQSNAAGNASKAAQQAAQQNLQFEQGVYSNAQGNLNPTITEGNQAGGALAGLLGTGGNATASQNAFQNYLNSTNYKFQLGQGEAGITYANAPAFSSGATAKALNNYAQGQAGSALQGYEGLLQGQQGLGVQAGSALAGVGTNIGGQVASANNSAASAIGGADITGANAWMNALKGIGTGAASSSSFGSNVNSAAQGIGGALSNLFNPNGASSSFQAAANASEQI